MSRTFIHESDAFPNGEVCGRFEVTVEFEADGSEYDDPVDGVITSVWSLDEDREVPLESFPEVERRSMEKAAQGLAYEYGGEWRLEQAMIRGEAAYDAWKEGEGNE